MAWEKHFRAIFYSFSKSLRYLIEITGWLLETGLYALDFAVH